MKLTIVIPCLNAEATLAVQLDALSAQDWSEPWEVIISDNGSTDNSVRIAKEYCDKLPALRVIDAADRKGPAHARNVGVRAARAEAIAFCDADDEVGPGWVAIMGELLSEHDVVYGQFHFDKFNTLEQTQRSAERWKNGLYRGRFLPGGGSGNLGVRRSVHEAIEGFDEDLGHSEDADYYWRLQLEGFQLHYAPNAVVQVRHARVNPTAAYLYRRARIRVASNHWLYKRYRSLGMTPPPPAIGSLTPWLRGLLRLPRNLLTNKRRGSWLRKFAVLTGQLVGNFQGQLTNPIKPYCPRQKGHR